MMPKGHKVAEINKVRLNFQRTNGDLLTFQVVDTVFEQPSLDRAIKHCLAAIESNDSSVD